MMGGDHKTSKCRCVREEHMLIYREGSYSIRGRGGAGQAGAGQSESAAGESLVAK